MKSYWWVRRGDNTIVPCELLDDAPDNPGHVVVYLIGYDDKVEFPKDDLVGRLAKPRRAA